MHMHSRYESDAVLKTEARWPHVVLDDTGGHTWNRS